MALVNNLDKLIKRKQKELKAMGEKHTTQARIAFDLGIDPSTLSLIKTGKVDMVNIKLWQRMADYFGVDGSEIFNVTPDKRIEA